MFFLDSMQALAKKRKEHRETEFSTKKESSKVTLLSFLGEVHFEQNFGHKAENEKTTPLPPEKKGMKQPRTRVQGPSWISDIRTRGGLIGCTSNTGLF